MSLVRRNRFLLIAVVFCCLAPCAAVQPKDETPKKKPKFTVGKETTHVTGPIDKEGYVDYVAALNEKLRDGVTPDNNANVLLWKAFGPNPSGAKVPTEFFEMMRMPTPPAKGDYYINVHRWAKDRQETQRLFAEIEAARTRPWTVKDFPQVAKWLKENEKPLATTIEATKRTQYYYPLLTPKANGKRISLTAALIPGVQESREIATALAASAMLRLGEGKDEEAWQVLLACHRLGRLVARGGSLMEEVHGISIDKLAADGDLAFLEHTKVNAKKAINCLRDLQNLPSMSPVADKVNLHERFMFLDTIMQIDYHGVGHIESLVGGGGGPQPRFANLAASLFSAEVNWDPALRSGNSLYSRHSAALRLKDRTLRVKQHEAIELEIRSIRSNLLTPEQFGKTLFGTKNLAEAKGRYLGEVLISRMYPAMWRVQQAADRSEQVQRNLHLAFALAAFNSDEGRYPQNLDALAPKYLAAIPDDLFTGKELIYRPADNGYLLYSVGINGKDDGGQGADDEPRGDDLVIRMPRPRSPERKQSRIPREDAPCLGFAVSSF